MRGPDKTTTGVQFGRLFETAQLIVRTKNFKSSWPNMAGFRGQGLVQFVELPPFGDERPQLRARVRLRRVNSAGETIIVDGQILGRIFGRK